MEPGLLILIERRKRGIEQQELERRLGSGYSDSTLSRIERGKRKLKAEEFTLIWKALTEERSET